jgi:hypothetical protein
MLCRAVLCCAVSCCVMFCFAVKCEAYLITNQRMQCRRHATVVVGRVHALSVVLKGLAGIAENSN